MLGAFTGLAGRQAIAAMTVAIERVVLRHMHEQVAVLAGSDAAAAGTLRAVIADSSPTTTSPPRGWPRTDGG